MRRFGGETHGFRLGLTRLRWHAVQTNTGVVLSVHDWAGVQEEPIEVQSRCLVVPDG
jgi:hypothetical protein